MSTLSPAQSRYPSSPATNQSSSRRVDKPTPQTFEQFSMRPSGSKGVALELTEGWFRDFVDSHNAAMIEVGQISLI